MSNTTHTQLVNLIRTDLEAGVLDWDDPKWDAYTVEQLEAAGGDLGCI
jgi:hypothetical protein